MSCLSVFSNLKFIDTNLVFGFNVSQKSIKISCFTVGSQPNEKTCHRYQQNITKNVSDALKCPQIGSQLQVIFPILLAFETSSFTLNLVIVIVYKVKL